MFLELYVRTLLALRVARAFFGKKYTHDGVAIRGQDTFVSSTVQALELLKAKTPDVYELLRRHVGDILAVKPSGVLTSMVKIGPAIVLVGPAISGGSVIEYAGVLAHESYHCELYSVAKARNPRGKVQTSAYSGEHAERLCLRYQCDVLKRLGLDDARIGAYESRLDTRWWETPLSRRDW